MLPMSAEISREEPMKSSHIHFIIILFLCCWLPARMSCAAEQATFTKEELKRYFATQLKLFPDNGNMYRKLIAAFPGKEVFTADEVTAVTDPQKAQDFDYEKNKDRNRSKDIEPDGFTLQQVADEFKTFKKRNPDTGDLWAILVKKYGKQPWYKGYEIRDVEVNGKDNKQQTVNRPASDPVAVIVQEIKERPKTFWEDFKSPRIRQSWRDVLYDEDRSQQDKENAVLSDLVGATLSYSHDGKTNSDTWSAIGAVILPWEKNYPLTQGFSLRRLAFAPSVGVNRVSTNGDASGESDSLLFRLGGYADVQLARNPSTGVQLRAAAVYATDTGFRASLPGYETDIEPRVNFRPFPIGYKKVWIPKAELKDDKSDNSCFDTQLRIWLHIEGGDVQDNGDTWDTAKGSFFRLGPTVQLQAEWPKLMFGRDASLTAFGSYLAPVSGSSNHNWHFKITGVYDLFKDDERGQKVSLNINYEKGGLNLTKEDVDTFTVGLGVLF
jgi:hypothetical protein